MGDEFATRLKAAQDATEAVLTKLLADEPLEGEIARPSRLLEAMRYAALGAGKRLRPFILIESARLFAVPANNALGAAAALECVHCYSLIHDDLPAMDDDDFRRGKPTSHKVFGEGTAILAGDALLTDAFRVMAESHLAHVDPGRAVRAIADLARAAGGGGMVGGQQMDLSAAPGSSTAAEVDEIELRKTAALLASCARTGAILGGGSPAQVDALGEYGTRLGLLFQVTDDILDETGSFEEMGKGTAKDRARGKWTYPVAHGMPAAIERASELERAALAAVSAFGAEADPLRELVGMVRNRRK